MKILFLNNYYYVRGGSERVFFGEMALMKQHGHETAGYARRHPADLPSKYGHLFPPDIQTETIRFSWKSVKTACGMFYSRDARRGLNKLVDEFRPDIAHVHNMYGRLTTSVLDLLKERHVPVVMTLHDCKLACPSYRFIRDGRVCEDCIGGRYYNCVRNRCHKGSYAASVLIALESYFCELFDRYRKNIRLFISPSRFLRQKLIESGWPAGMIRTVPNFINIEEFEPNYFPGEYFLYMGRLSEEKGVNTLIRSFSRLPGTNARLVIAGEGPLRGSLECLANSDSRIGFTGHLSGRDLAETIRNAMAVVIPSECYENAPMSIIESMASGKPVIGASTGGIPEMVTEGADGLLFEPGNVEDLTNALRRFTDLSRPEIEAMGKAARMSAEISHSSKTHYMRVSEIYQQSLSGG